MKGTNNERAVDGVGRPPFKSNKSFGSDSTQGRKSGSGSTKGVGGGLKSENTVSEPIFHEASYRTGGKDKNYEAKPQSGLPRMEASYTNRDRSGTGVEKQPKYQSKLQSYPTKGPATKRSNTQDD